MAKLNNFQKDSLKKIINMLKFISTIDDVEIIKSTVESVAEMLEDFPAK